MIRPVLLAVPAALAALAAGASATFGQQGQPPPPPPSPPPAQTAVFTFTGRGWGHGVGMSQYGARGRALAGWSAARILRYYYRGTSLGVVRGRWVRVLLSPSRRVAAFSSPAAWRAIGARAGGRRVTSLPAGVAHRLRMLPDGRVALERGGRRVAVFAGAVRLQAVPRHGVVVWGPRRPEPSRSYRGGLVAVPSGGRFALVNVVGMQDYLRGVVPREMPAEWGDDAMAALEAQAIAARSYAVSTMKPTATYDVFADQRSQVYGGASAEDPRTSRAVDRTAGRVVTYHGQVITAYFFSTSGGRTEDVQNVFPGSPPLPYLVSVPDPFDRLSPYHVWSDPPSFTAQDLGRRLGLDGPVADVTVISRGSSPRVREVGVTTLSGGSTALSGAQVRAALGLRDTWFSVTRRDVPATAAARPVGG